jgi:DNA-binding transcriptional ArsR family regulator
MSYHHTNNKLDPSRLALDDQTLQLAKRPRGGGRQVRELDGNFIKGPITVVWLIQAAKLGRTPLLLGLVLWYLVGLRKANTVLLSNITCREWGIEPDAKRRALKKLEKAGLVSVKGRGRTSPKVTIRTTPSNDEMASRRPAEAPQWAITFAAPAPADHQKHYG